MLKKILLTIYLASSISYSQVATPYTKQANIQFNLPHKDNQDFKDAARGFISSLPNKGIIKDSEGNIVWDLSKYDFVNNTKALDGTVNPSLWRQAKLLTKTGLFKVADRIYQIRGADISNMTIIESKTGIIIVDTLLSTETAAAAINLYFQYRPIKPIVAIIYTHSHLDHFGSTRGLISEDLSNKIRIIAPQSFANAAFSENIMAANVMGRRASYMYGNLLTPGLKSQIGCGLALGSSSGKQSLVLPNELISKTGQEKIIDGLNSFF